jgi:thiosulfate/3-mercaptopyruvate sulfurtransferase
MRSLLTAGVLAMLAATAAAEAPHARLVAFADLQNRLADPSLRLLDARPRADYDRGHLPGAVWVDPAAVGKMIARPGALADRELWARWIEPLGIGPGSTVLVYDARRQLDAARVWWLLTYMGVSNAGLIDGSFPLWAEQGRPTTTDAPAVAARPFAVEFRADRHAARAAVLAAVKERSARVVDARSRGEYTGEAVQARRGGRIPGACHLEWTELVGRDGRFLPEAALREKVAAANLDAGAPVITYCQVGLRASVDGFVLERLGHPTRVYVESWADWGNADDTPVETGPPQAR